jgi:hypothetical protein
MKPTATQIKLLMETAALDAAQKEFDKVYGTEIKAETSLTFKMCQELYQDIIKEPEIITEDF